MPRSRKRATPKRHKRNGPRRPNDLSLIRRALQPGIARRQGLFDEARQEAVAAIPSEFRQDRTMDALEAVEPLATVRQKLEELGRVYAQSMSAYSWLFWLRRVPREIFEGRLATTGPYVQALAEAMSADSAVAQDFTAAKIRRVIPELDQSQLETLMKMCELASALAGVHSVIRRAGKGQAVRWRRDDIPWVVSDPELDCMIELYDQRVLSGGEYAGTLAFDWRPLFTPGKAANVRDFALVVYPVAKDAKVPFWSGPANKIRQSSFKMGRYVVGGMTLEEVRRLLEMSPTSPSWPSKELCSLIILLRALMFAVLEQDFKQGFQLPSVGYVVLPTETIPELMAIDLPWNQNNLRDLFGEGVPRSASEIFADVERLKPSTWPLLKGPVFRISGEQTIIDLDSATGLLDRMFTIPSQFGGALVNARAEHFEDYVQQVIDQSSWAPSPALRGYKRKTLRLGGKSVTDIDAIAVKGKNIILVSCKSIPYTFDYDMGIYNTVRNVRTLLEDADGEWRDRLAVLRANPSGDNYNFEAYDLLGVVCTPHVFFVNEPQARIILQADDKVLRAICSVTELRRFLMLEPADAQAPARQE